MINANCWLKCVTSCGTCNCLLKWLYHFICSLTSSVGQNFQFQRQ
ncbi:unnamed protein product [Gulo gulo]|uniref:Uncharacterized protein n=1 Tax=Gulo gulo TaxID=48420 RepID=A0A9X9LYY0_GULGU|nr:unnamed protein product [Gulo gulo]